MGASGLGALLVKEGFLTEQDRVTITKTCGQGSWAFAKCILSTGLLDEDELSAFFAERTKYVVAPKNLLDRLDAAILEQIDRRMVSRLEVLPLEIDHHKITVAVADPLDKSTIKQLEFFTGLEVVSVIAPLSQIYEGLSRLNPEFKPRPTALSNFLRNHAGAAWIKQKIVEEGDVDVPQEKRAARAVVDDYAEEQVEDVALDDEIDALEDSSDSLSDIDAGGLDEGIGNSDFDDIELEDNGSDLELTPGDDPDADGEAIDDAGLDLDDPFDNFEDAPKPGKAVAAPSDDDLEGLETGGGASDDLWPDADEASAAAAPVPKAAADDLLDESADLGGLGFDEEPKARVAKKAEDDFDLGAALDDEPEPVKTAGKTAAKADDDDFGLGGLDDLKAADDDFGLSDDESIARKTVKKADDDFGSLDVGSFDDEAKASVAADDDFGRGDEARAAVDDFDAEEPKPKAAAAAKKSEDDFGGLDDLDLDEKPKAAAGLKTAKSANKSLEDDFGGLDDLDLNETPKAAAGPKTAKSANKAAKKSEDDFGGLGDLSLDDHIDLNADLAAEDIDALLDEPAPPLKAGSDRLALPNLQKSESTRMAEKPNATPLAHDDDRESVEFADDEETSISLRKAVHEDGVLPEFADPSADGFKEETRIDLNVAIEDKDELSFHEEDTSIELHAAIEDAGGLENLAMDFEDEDAIDEPAAVAAKPIAQAKPAADSKPVAAARLVAAEKSVTAAKPVAGEKPVAANRPIAAAEPVATETVTAKATAVAKAAAAAKPITAAKPLARSIPSEPTIDDFDEAGWSDIPIDEPAPLARAGGSPAIGNGSVASLTATAKANEALLRMSLCFDRTSALAIAREYLPQISETGCLIDIGKTTEALATWRSGAQSTAKGKGARTIQTMAKAARPGQWSQVAVNGSDELFGPVQTVSVYTIQKADGRTLLLAGDYPIEDETLREALTSFAEQLGAK